MSLNSIATTFPLPSPHVLLFQLVLGSASVGLTQPDSFLRPAVLPLVSTCTYNIVSTASQQMRTRWASLLGGASFAFLLQYVDLALLSRWSYETHGSAPEFSFKKSSEQLGSSAKQPPMSTSSFWKRAWFGWCSMWAFRHVGSPYEVRNVPPFFQTDPNYTPSRWTFVVQETLKATACYIALDMMGMRAAPKNNGELFNKSLIPFFRRLNSVTFFELKLRALSIFGFAFTFYCVIQGFSSAAGALTVSLHFSDVKSWRPPFGSISDAYSLGNVWG